MNITCILCDKIFITDDHVIRKLTKQPHRLVLCPTCHDRIKTKSLLRKKINKSKSQRSSILKHNKISDYDR